MCTLKWLVDHVFEQHSEELHDHLDSYSSADDMVCFIIILFVFMGT